jgi:hypothetical protein
MMVGQRGGRRPDALLQNPPSVISDRFVVQEAKTEMAADRDRQRVSSREVTCTVVPEDELHSLLLAALAGAWCAGAHSTVPCHHHCPLSLQRPETYFHQFEAFGTRLVGRKVRLVVGIFVPTLLIRFAPVRLRFINNGS